MTAYYNEIDRYAAQWLRNLIDAGHIAPGIVDERSIEDVHPSDLAGFTQCHFFAGIGVWSYALRRAGWPDDRPVWTGSCPCQPFSSAGKGAGFADERHLWPAFHWLIQERRPPVVYGEQVASSDVGPWLDLVQADLEAMDYALGCVAFPSAGVGAPHIRGRLYWVAHADRGQFDGVAIFGGDERVGHDAGRTQECGEPQPCGDLCGVADSAGQRERTDELRPDCRNGQQLDRAEPGSDSRHHGTNVKECSNPGPTNGHWRDADWLLCRDGKWRPVEPGTFPLAHGAPYRVGRLRAYGNAINAQAAEIFIRATL